MNENRGQGILMSVFSQRRYIVEIIILSIIIASGINLITNSLPILVQWSDTTTLILGSLLCVLPLIHFIRKLLRKRILRRNIEAFFIFDDKENKLITVPEYDFSENLSRNLDCVFTENRNLKSIWKNDSLQSLYLCEDNENDPKLVNPKSAQIINEAIEYYIITELSSHLDKYFSSKEFRDKNLKVFERKDIPNILLKNRFIELFSKNTDERKLFFEEEKEWKEFEESEEIEHGETYSMYLDTDEGPILYEKFELILPKGTSIKRIGNTTISIDMKRIKVELNVDFTGYYAVIPPDFIEYYLGFNFKDLFEDISEFQVPISISVQFKFLSLLFPIRRQYYDWIDQFIKELEEKTSQELFFKRINWDGAKPIIKILENKGKLHKSKKKAKD